MWEVLHFTLSQDKEEKAMIKMLQQSGKRSKLLYSTHSSLVRFIHF